jgi:Holliday junction DNA helicase RuvA
VIRRLSGQLADIEGERVILETGGVGFEVLCPHRVIMALRPQIGEPCTLQIHLAFRPDEVALFGFLGASDLAFFRLLLSVSGVGPKMALGILDHGDAAFLARAITLGEGGRLGCGRRIAEHVVAELRDRVAPFLTAEPEPEGASSFSDTVQEDAVDGLHRLGFSIEEARSVVSASAAEAIAAGETASVASLVGAGLHKLHTGVAGRLVRPEGDDHG